LRAVHPQRRAVRLRLTHTDSHSKPYSDPASALGVKLQVFVASTLINCVSGVNVIGNTPDDIYP
jgi:hypothetical protein